MDDEQDEEEAAEVRGDTLGLQGLWNSSQLVIPSHF